MSSDQDQRKEYQHLHYLKNKEKYLKNKKIRAQKKYNIEKETISKKLSDWKENNPEKLKAQWKRYRLKKYGLTENQYLEMCLKQNNVCFICFLPSHKSLNVDHNHLTKKVRKLLCFRCNIVIGHLKEDIELVHKISNYIKTNGEII